MNKQQIIKIINSGEATEENFNTLCEYIKPFVIKQGVKPDENALLQYVVDFVKKSLKTEKIDLEKLGLEFNNFMQYYEHNDWCSGSGRNKKPITNWNICASRWFSTKTFRFKAYESGYSPQRQQFIGELK